MSAAMYKHIKACHRILRLQLQMPSTFPVRQICSSCLASLRTNQIRAAMSLQQRNSIVQGRELCTATEKAKTREEVLTLHGTRLANRSLILVKGRDVVDLLQGLTTNDIEMLTNEGSGGAMYTMFLNKQGRVLYDVICYSSGQQEDVPVILMECDANVSSDLQKHLKFYRIRKKVDIASIDSEYDVWSVYGPEATPPPQAPDSHLCSHKQFADPRVKGLGQRVIVPKGNQVSDVDEASEDDYRTHRYQWGVPEGVSDLPPGDSLPLEANLALMNGVSFTKGCYLGQELTARTHHTGVIRKRVMPVELSGDGVTTIPPGTIIKTNEGKNVGKLRGHLQQNGLALLRTALIGNKLHITTEGGGDVELMARAPSWWPEEILATK